VFERVFGRNGLLRRCESTVILSTHSGECGAQSRERGQSIYLTFNAVRHLPSADNIIALGRDGAIVEHGNFHKLQNAGGYIQSLDIMAGTSRDTGDANNREAESQLTKKLTAAAEGVDDLKQTMDTSIWMYYARSLGWFRIAAFVLLLGVYGGIGSFRCKPYSAIFSWCALTRIKTNMRIRRCLAHMVGIH
jgi:ATP-binding cassette, subfamily C (CFTR/MRP), member 1